MGQAAANYNKIWFNTTKNVNSISMTEGNSTFIYQREDFNAKINRGTRKRLFICDGKINLDINNLLICSFITPYFGFDDFYICKGIMTYQFEDNNVEYYNYSFSHKGNYYERTSNYPFEFFSFSLFSPGNYTFGTSCIQLSGPGGGFPDVQLVGAEVILPK
jgi:hypothetical protein